MKSPERLPVMASVLDPDLLAVMRKYRLKIKQSKNKINIIRIIHKILIHEVYFFTREKKYN